MGEKLTVQQLQWHWIVKLDTWVGRTCEIETTDGCYRKGEITGLQLNVLDINGRIVYLPVSVELNNDPTDRLEFHRFKAFKLGDFVNPPEIAP